jgi:hypothetical protein
VLRALAETRRRAAHAAALALLAAAAAAGCGDDPTGTPRPGGRPTVDQFQSPEVCAECHPNHYAEWRASMHAYAFTDPVFFAINAREQTATGGALGSFCVSCHTPIGHVTGETDGTFDREALPEIVLAGVSCDVCHTMRPNPATETYDRADETGGRFRLEPGRKKYGPMDQVVDNPFHDSVQDHTYDRSDFCLPCHNLELRGILLEGTFDEWNTSSFAINGPECQGCHMPEYSGQAAVGGPERARLHRHTFAGVDVAMTPFPDREAQRARVEALLREAAELLVALPESAAPEETVVVRVSVHNLSGHSLPSGTTFERQMWIEIAAVADGADTLLVSGTLDGNGDLRDEHSELDPSGDPSLTLWTARLLGGPEGDDVTVFRATGIEARVIPAAGVESRDYAIPLADMSARSVRVTVRLLFRPFAPHVLRERGVGHLAPENPVFEMERFEGTVAVGGA